MKLLLERGAPQNWGLMRTVTTAKHLPRRGSSGAFPNIRKQSLQDWGISEPIPAFFSPKRLWINEQLGLLTTEATDLNLKIFLVGSCHPSLSRETDPLLTYLHSAQRMSQKWTSCGKNGRKVKRTSFLFLGDIFGSDLYYWKYLTFCNKWNRHLIK